MRLHQISESVGTIDMIYGDSVSTYRYMYNITPMSFASNIKMAILCREVAGGIYDMSIDDILLWKRYDLAHNHVIDELKLPPDKIISFYIKPLGRSGQWTISISDFATPKSLQPKALDILRRHPVIIKAIGLAGQMGYKYLPEEANVF